jgi:hypothetical protein
MTRKELAAEAFQRAAEVLMDKTFAALEGDPTEDAVRRAQEMCPGAQVHLPGSTITIETDEPEEVTRAIETEELCVYCEEPLSSKPTTPYGIHIDCVHALNGELDAAFGGPPRLIEE